MDFSELENYCLEFYEESIPRGKSRVDDLKWMGLISENIRFAPRLLNGHAIEMSEERDEELLMLYRQWVAKGGGDVWFQNINADDCCSRCSRRFAACYCS